MAIQKLNVVVFQTQEPGSPQCWAAQALEYTVFAEGDSVHDAMDNFALAFAAEISYCEKHALPLSSIGKPPKAFLEMVAQAVDRSVKLDADDALERLVPKSARGNIGNFGAMLAA